MTIDCTNLKPGDKVRLRNNDIETVTGIVGSNTIYLSNGQDCYGSGEYDVYEDCENDLDIVEILTNPEPEMDATGTKVISWRYHLGTLELSDFPNLDPARIAINGKEYVPADSVSPEVHYKSGSFTAVKSTDNGELLAVWHNEKRFTPADFWPEPITDRDPTEEDGDDSDLIQYLEDGLWSTRAWVGGSYCLPAGAGWAHTPNWRPRPIDKKTLTIRDLKEAMRDGENPDRDTLQSAIELLEATP